ncbi:MAG: ADP-ribosylation/crystallin J1 [Flavobacterium sp.]
MKTQQLFRPVGLKEMELIVQSGWKHFPPRLAWQPIFYPVLNQAYAEQIAKEWNKDDEFSGNCGIVTAFEVSSEFLKPYSVQNVGAANHNELWIPAEKMSDFNQNIVGNIQIINAFFGKKFQNSTIQELNIILDKFK